jgi:hypothetical protein
VTAARKTDRHVGHDTRARLAQAARWAAVAGAAALLASGTPVRIEIVARVGDALAWRNGVGKSRARR